MRRRYDDFDHVVVTAWDRHGSTKLHAFIRLMSVEGDLNSWRLFTPQTAKQRTAYQQQRDDLAQRVRSDPSVNYIDKSDNIHRALWPASGEVGFGEALGSARLDLGDGVTPEGSTLAVILEALHANDRSKVDRDDIKVVLSQLGSRITQLDKLPDEQQRTARVALQSEIVRRCTTL